MGAMPLAVTQCYHKQNQVITRPVYLQEYSFIVLHHDSLKLSMCWAVKIVEIVTINNHRQYLYGMLNSWPIHFNANESIPL